MQKIRTKSVVLGAALVAVLGTTAAECRATEASPYPIGQDGEVVKRELVKKPINVKDHFLTTISQDGRDTRKRFQVNETDYDACQQGDDYPMCAGR